MSSINKEKFFELMQTINKDGVIFKNVIQELHDSTRFKDFIESLETCGIIAENTVDISAYEFSFACGFELGYEYYNKFGSTQTSANMTQNTSKSPAD